MQTRPVAGDSSNWGARSGAPRARPSGTLVDMKMNTRRPAGTDRTGPAYRDVLSPKQAQRPLASSMTDDARWAAIQRRDGAAAGSFIYAVATTGVYCRPSCGSRLALRRNVSFHADADAAERAGFRPCLRCRPRDQPSASRQAALVAQARAQLEIADTAITLSQLSTAAGLSPHHFHRLFKREVGLTPGQYAAAARLRRFTSAANAESSVTAAMYQAGYSSSGRFYEAGRALGMRPSDLRRGGAKLEVRVTFTACSLGRLLVATTSRGICAVSIGNDDDGLLHELRARFPRAHIAVIDNERLETSNGTGRIEGNEADEGLATLAIAIARGIEGAGFASDLPLDLIGTAFQQKVWRALRTIPAGTTTTYAELAQRIGSPGATRAVGTACGANPLAVVVPCHRVVRSDGELGGYRWGLERKEMLLEREAALGRARPSPDGTLRLPATSPRKRGEAKT